LGSVGLSFQITGQFPQKRFYANSALYRLEADPINTGISLVGLDQSPCVMEDIITADLVVERVKMRISVEGERSFRLNVNTGFD